LIQIATLAVTLGVSPAFGAVVRGSLKPSSDAVVSGSVAPSFSHFLTRSVHELEPTPNDAANIASQAQMVSAGIWATQPAGIWAKQPPKLSHDLVVFQPDQMLATEEKPLTPASDAGQAAKFKQTIIVCNAYHDKSRMHVARNRQHIRGETRGIPFKQCREIESHVQPKDTIEVAFNDIQGTFQITDTPATDSMFLLVVEKRDKDTPRLAFRSYAFPIETDSDTAHLAVIDAVKENSHLPYLKMEDHRGHNVGGSVAKRIEQLKFNHVYNIMKGSYDLSILDHDQPLIDNDNVQSSGHEERGNQVKKGFVRTMKMDPHRNYVVLRIGHDDHVGQSLVVYPDLNSGSTAMRSTVAFVTIITSALLMEEAMVSFPLLAALM